MVWEFLTPEVIISGTFQRKGSDFFYCDLHLPGPHWAQGQGQVALGTLFSPGWGFSLADELSVVLRSVCLAPWPVVLPQKVTYRQSGRWFNECFLTYITT